MVYRLAVLGICLALGAAGAESLNSDAEAGARHLRDVPMTKKSSNIDSELTEYATPYRLSTDMAPRENRPTATPRKYKVREIHGQRPAPVRKTH
jgi:hypothetical protein